MYTEDETYDALRRVPLDELKRRHGAVLDHFALMHIGYVREHKEVEKILKKQEWRMKYRWILGWPDDINYPRINVFSSAYIACLRQLRDDDLFDGTGWTIDDYIDVLNKQIADNAAVTKSNNRKVTAATAGAMVPTVIASVAVKSIFRPAWYIVFSFDIALGITVGLIVAKIAEWRKWR